MNATRNGSELGQKLRPAIGRVYRRFRSMRPAGELGDVAMSVLSHLDREGPQTLSALSERDRVTPGSMSQTVNRLTAAGYAERSPDPSDGRRVLFTATAAGRALAEQSRVPMEQWLDSRLASLTDHERSVLDEAADVLFKLADG